MPPRKRTTKTPTTPPEQPLTPPPTEAQPQAPEAAQEPAQEPQEPAQEAPRPVPAPPRPRPDADGWVSFLDLWNALSPSAQAHYRTRRGYLSFLQGYVLGVEMRGDDLMVRLA